MTTVFASRALAIGCALMAALACARFDGGQGGLLLPLLQQATSANSAGGSGGSTPTPAWSLKQRLTFDNSSRNENLTNFPVLVVLNTARMNYSSTLAAGADIRFLDSDGTLLAHEIERWDSAGTSYVWVRVPQIDALSTTDHIWLYYGNTSASDNQAPSTLWNEYALVQHMAQDPAGTAPQMQDSSGNANHATSNGTMTSTDSIDAQIGKGLALDGINDYLNIANSTTLDITGTALTIVGWVRSANWAPSGDAAMLNKGPAVNNEHYFLGVGSTAVLNLRLVTGGTFHRTDTGAVPVNAWTFIAHVYNGATMKGYVNGVEVSSLNKTGNINSTAAEIRIGARFDGRRMLGDVDEIRIAPVARSLHWLTAQNASMRDSLITYGSAEATTSSDPSP